MQLLTILVCHNVSSSGSGVSSQDNTILEHNCTNCCSSFGHLKHIYNLLFAMNFLKILAFYKVSN